MTFEIPYAFRLPILFYESNLYATCTLVPWRIHVHNTTIVTMKCTLRVDFQNLGRAFFLPQSGPRLPLLQSVEASFDALNMNLDRDLISNDIRHRNSRPQLLHIRIQIVKRLQRRNDMRQSLLPVPLHVLEQIESKVHLPQFPPVPSEPCPEFGKDVFLCCRQGVVIPVGFFVKDPQVFFETEEVAHGNLRFVTETSHVIGDVIH